MHKDTKYCFLNDWLFCLCCLLRATLPVSLMSSLFNWVYLKNIKSRSTILCWLYLTSTGSWQTSATFHSQVNYLLTKTIVDILILVSFLKCSTAASPSAQYWKEYILECRSVCRWNVQSNVKTDRQFDLRHQVGASGQPDDQRRLTLHQFSNWDSAEDIEPIGNLRLRPNRTRL